jgi:hypothetical protein
MSALSVSAETSDARRWNAGHLDTHGEHDLSAAESTSVTTDIASLDVLDPAAQELAVTQMLDQSRQWLDRAMESTNPAREVSEFKAFVATVAEAAKQKKLSEGIQLDAIEMVRRSERALGVAIREGQARGNIRVRGASGGPGSDYQRADGRTVRVDQSRDTTLISPGDYFAHNTEAVQTYAVTDDVTDEQYEMAISRAKEEGNLSRRNVVQKVQEVKSGVEQREDTWGTVADHAGRGWTSTQIAKAVGMTEQWLRTQAKQRGITFPADKLTNRLRIDPLKVIDNVVASMEANGASLALVSYEDVTPEMAEELLERLAPGIKAIHQLKTALKERTKENI